MKNNRQLIAITINVVVLVLIFFGLFYNEWGVYDFILNNSSDEHHVGLREYTEIDVGVTHNRNWGEWDNGFYTAGIVTFFILWMAVVCCIVSIVVSIPIKLKKSYRRLGIRTNFITAGIIFFGVTLWMIFKASEKGDYEEFHYGWVFYGMIGAIILQIISAAMLMKCYPKERDSINRKENRSKIISIKLHMKRFGIVYISSLVIIALLMGIISHNWAYHKRERRSSGGLSYGGNTYVGLRYIIYDRDRAHYVPLSDPESFFSGSMDGYKSFSDLNTAGRTTEFLLWTGIFLICVFLGIYLFSLTHDKIFDYSLGIGILSGIIIIIAPIIWYWLAPIKEDYWSLGWSFYIILSAGIVQIATSILYRFIFRNNMKDVEAIVVEPI